jgi:hypothetical protein
MLSTDQKGAIAESAIVHAAIKLGIDVFKPVSDGERYDLVFDLGPKLLRVQCKSAARYGDVVVIRCYSARRTRSGVVRRCYTAEEVDAIGAYCAELNRCYLLPPKLFEGRTVMHLRLAPTRNNQKLAVNWADDFEFARVDWKALAGP